MMVGQSGRGKSCPVYAADVSPRCRSVVRLLLAEHHRVVETPIAILFELSPQPGADADSSRSAELAHKKPAVGRQNTGPGALEEYSATVTSSDTPVVTETTGADGSPDPRESLNLLFRDLRTSELGLSAREAERRLLVYGPNELPRPSGRGGRASSQASHPPACHGARGRSRACLGDRHPGASGAIVAVIALNAGFAFFQELQAERAVEALAAYLPSQVHVLRDRHRRGRCPHPGAR